MVSKSMIRLSLFLISMTFLTPYAWAHSVVASAYAEGDQIEGEIGFSNGDMAAGVLVEVFDEDGGKLGETTTDADGVFLFTPSARIIHVFRSNLGAGHIAEYRMELEELPETLIVKSGLVNNAKAESAPSSKTASLVQNNTDLEKAIAEAVRREVKPLRKEIAAYKQKNDLQTILGGIGYILGLFGIAFYILANRKLKLASKEKSE